MKFDETHSVKNRDLKLEETLLHDLYGQYIDRYINEMSRLDSQKDFIHDNTYHGIESGHHIAYKYIVEKNPISTRLNSPDGCRAYEFLIEFDKEDSSYGIYYGCRGLILGGDQKEQIDIMLNEWKNELEEPTLTVLNNTFPDMDFTNRFQPTNNANNKTFWPFWIALGIEEDIIEVAARATALIAKAYICNLRGDKLITPNINRKRERSKTRTYFTEDAYKSIEAKLGKFGSNKIKEYHQFIRTGEKNGVFKRVKQYERCYQFTRLALTEIASFVYAASQKMNLIQKGSDSIPWALFDTLFLAKDGSSLKNIKTAHSYNKNYSKTEKSSLNQSNAEVEASKCLKNN